MKRNIARFLMAAGTALFLVLSAWTTVSAAKATGRFLASKLINTATTQTVTDTPTTTGIPVITSTQQASNDDRDESVTTGRAEKPELDQNDDQDEDDGSSVTSGTTGSTEMGEDDTKEHNSDAHMSSASQPGNGDDEDNHHSGSGSGDSDEGGGDD